MRHHEDRFAGVGDKEIYWQAWLPDGDARRAVVIAHGVSEHSGRYEHVGRALSDAGYAVYAADHRGHGRSDGGGANIEGMQHVIADLLTVVETAAEREGGKPFLLGHSMGGSIAIGFAIEHQDAIEALILSAPAVDISAVSPLARALSRIASAVTPNLGAVPIEADGVSRDPEVVRAYVGDPLVHTGKLPARTANELLTAAQRYPDQLAGVRIPVLILHGGADPLIPLAASEMVDERIGSEDKTKIVYDGLYHEILNEPEQDKVLADIVSWLDARTPPR